MPEETTKPEDGASSTVHRRVLGVLKGQKVDHDGRQYEFRIEAKKGRLDLPNPKIVAKKKDPGQRKRSLSYTDAILVGQDNPRLLIEVVDSSPRSPTGIAGLTINADRIAGFYGCKLDLVFIILAEMKEFFCVKCKKGHRLTSVDFHSHFQQAWPSVEAQRQEILHEGIATQYRKTLCDYPIKPYLKFIAPPTVLFLNRGNVKESWATYKALALGLILRHVTAILNGSNVSDSAQFVGIEEIIPVKYRGLLSNPVS